MPKKRKRKSPPKHKPSPSIRTKVLFLSGIILLLIPGIFYLNQTIQLAFFTPKVPPVVTQKNLPIPNQLEIPSIKVDLPIVETAIQNNIWEIAQNGVSHLATSARPGENGPIILYAHNTKDRFGQLKNVKKGTSISLGTNEKTYRYTVTKTEIVTPEQLSIFFSEKGSTLFLYTCYGFADLKRFVVIAKPINSN